MNEQKTVLITGATSGIGKETAIGLIKLGYSLNILVRNKIKAEELAKEIKVNFNTDIGIFIADLSDLQSVIEVSETIKNKLKKIDILINNAGGIFDKYQETKDGIEQTFATNHVGPFLLTNLLLELIPQKGRIINVASGSHWTGHIDFDNLQLKDNFSSYKAYCNSKLANILFTKKLAVIVANKDITVNCLHPGTVGTGIGKDLGFPIGTMVRFVTRFLLSVKDGAKTSIYLASSDQVKNISGEYFVKCKVAKSSKESKDLLIADRLWEVTSKMVKLI